MMPDFFLALLTPRGAGQLGGVGLFLAICTLLYLVLLSAFHWLGLIVFLLLFYGAWAGYYFTILRETALGKQGLPKLQGLTEGIGAYFLSAIRFLLASALVLLPAWLYIRHVGWHLLLFQGWYHDPIILLLLAFALVYLPAALITASVTESTLAMLNPGMVLGIILRIPAHYLGVVVAWGLLMFAGIFVEGWLLTKLLAGSWPGVFGLLGKLWLSMSVGMIPTTVSAMLLGWVIFQNGEKLGTLRSSDLLVPAFPGAKPVGVAPDGGWEPKEKARKKAERVEPLPLEEAPAKPPQVALQDALAGETSDRVLAAYRRVQAAGFAPELKPELELRLAALLDKNEDSLGAVMACRRAAEKDPRGPVAARAIFTAARLLVERVGAIQDGVALYRYLLENYPGDELAERARGMLERLDRPSP
jgi:hypothetical protein